MNQPQSRRSSPRVQRGAPAVASALCAALVVAAACGGAADEDPEQAPELHRVERGDLRITVAEDGEIQALVEKRVRSQMEGRSQIKYLIDEGAQVEKGERLVELDSSEVVEKRQNQAIAVAKAESNYTIAVENNRILAQELDATENAAESKVTIAMMELEKFLGRAAEPGSSGSSQGTNQEMIEKLSQLIAEDEDFGPLYPELDPKIRELLASGSGDGTEVSPVSRDMGDLANKVLQQVDKIRLAQADLKIKEETKRYSEDLYAKNFITKNELDRDELSFESQKSAVTLAWNDLDLLINYTLVKEQLELTQNVENAKLELAQVKAANSARMAKENADLESAKAELELAKERLQNYEQQIENSTIFAPNPGIVVYAMIDSRRGEAISPESEVREDQTILILPDTTQMVADLKVLEADRDKVLAGQNARVTTDQGMAFPAKVMRVAPLPDSGSRWSSNDRKVYKTRVKILAENGNGALRPNMSCKVEIIISEIPDVLTVPSPAVMRQGAVHYVWKQEDGSPVAKRVTLGQISRSMVEVKEGLAEGDIVYKAPPKGFEAPSFEQPEGSRLEPASADEVSAAAAEANEAESAPAEEMTREEMSAAGRKIRTFLSEKFPEHAEQLSDPRKGMGLLRSNPELGEALEADPELGPLYARYQAAIQAMMSRFSQGGGGGGRGEGGRGRGEGGGRRGGGQ